MNVYVGSGWVAMFQKKESPLPTQNCCCHRIEIIKDTVKPHQISAVITEMASSRIFQIQLYHVEAHTMMIETLKPRDGEYYVVSYQSAGSVDSRKKNEHWYRVMESWSQAFSAYAAFAPRDAEGAIWLPDPAKSAAEFGLAEPEAAAAYDDLKHAFRTLCTGGNLNKDGWSDLRPWSDLRTQDSQLKKDDL